MPTYSLVLFYDISNIPQKLYMEEQRRAIVNSFPDLTVEVVDSTDVRLSLYSTTPQRVPCLMIFKNNARMQTKHAKLQHSEAINWVRAFIQ